MNTRHVFKKKKKKREFWISIAETALLHQDHHGLHIHTHWDSLGTLSKLGKNLSWVLPYMLKSIPVTPGTLQTSHTHIHAHVYVFTQLDCRLILVSVVLYNADVHKFTSSVGTRWKMRGIKKIRGRKVATMEKRTKKASDGGICRAFSWSPICVITEAAALPAFPVPQCTFSPTPHPHYTPLRFLCLCQM